MAALLMVTQASATGAMVDDQSSTPAEDPLIIEALEQGVITEADFVSPSTASLVAAAPTVTALAPATGPLVGGQIVALTGTGFVGATAVKFGSVDATDFAVVSASRIVAKVPNASAGGAVLMTVTNGDGTNTAGSNYTYVAPTVTAVSPKFADPDTEGPITITGTGFTGATAADVEFGTNVATSIFVVSDTQIVVTSPINDTTPDPDIEVDEGVVDVVVTRNSVASATSAATSFLFTSDLPVVTSLTDTSDDAVTGTDGVAVGSLLKVVGTDLWGVTRVNFGTVAVTASADITVASDGASLTVKVPTGKSGPVDITVQNVSGTSTANLATKFTYISTVAPKITAVTPNVLNKAAVSGGGTFLVTGTGLSGMTTAEVTIVCASDVTPTAVVVVSDTSLIVTAPGNGGTAATCGLKVDNPADGAKTFTLANAINYV